MLVSEYLTRARSWPRQVSRWAGRRAGSAWCAGAISGDAADAGQRSVRRSRASSMHASDTAWTTSEAFTSTCSTCARRRPIRSPVYGSLLEIDSLFAACSSNGAVAGSGLSERHDGQRLAGRAAGGSAYGHGEALMRNAGDPASVGVGVLHASDRPHRRSALRISLLSTAPRRSSTCDGVAAFAMRRSHIRMSSV
jgi:hypothetical protein